MTNYSISRLNMLPLVKTKENWEAELDETFPDECWDGAIDMINTSTSCAKLGLIQFKIFHRLHYCKLKLPKIYPNVDDKCDRCALTPANHNHMFWSCSKPAQYWTKIFEILSEVFSV